MPEIDEYEHEILEAYEKGSLKSIATKSEIAIIHPHRRGSRDAVRQRRPQVASSPRKVPLPTVFLPQRYHAAPEHNLATPAGNAASPT